MLLTVDSSPTMSHSVAESVTRAKNMMDRSRQGRTFRRFGSNESLRSQVPRGGTKGKPKRDVQTKSIKEKPFDFAFLNSKEDDTKDDFLRKEMVVERGMVTLDEQDSDMPTSRTSSNSLDLPRGNEVLPLPSDNELLELYDLAFKNNYFGVM